jgi:hypothetical protein
LFTSTYDGTVWALDDESLKPPWSFGTGCFSAPAPMTYAVNGKQYVAILIGNSLTKFPRGPSSGLAEHIDAIGRSEAEHVQR